ncbi:hypothetical protein [Acidisarcina polymorpha]|uniref:hypothetical protein n=1 Tax=Acidisarcina polymorpha TaxID=2211140 RepID=UPI001F407F50|nr:hypothetical protein [Acidisarcina polymorpha]
MSYDDITLWLITAMSLTAVAFLFWTFAAVVRTSRAALLDADQGRQLSSLAPGDHGPA